MQTCRLQQVMPAPDAGLPILPKELLALITSQLPTRDICSLEATCTALRAALRSPQARLAPDIC